MSALKPQLVVGSQVDVIYHDVLKLDVQSKYGSNEFSSKVTIVFIFIPRYSYISSM